MKKNIIIFGATGFIGRNLLEFYSKKKIYNVFATYNFRKKFEIKNVKWLKVNLLNSEQVSKSLKGINIVIQAAATTSGSKDIIHKPYLHVTDNAVMNSIILRECHSQKIDNFIFFSCTVMLPSLNRAVKENDFDLNKQLNPKYFGVAWTKIYIEKMCQFYSNINSSKYTIIRHSNVYGPNDKFDLEKSHVFGATITKVMSNKDGKILVWGDGKESRDIIYISDLVNFVDKVINNQKNNFRIYNCGYGKGIKIKELIKKIITHSNKNIKISYDLSQPSIYSNIYLNCKLAKEELGWKPKVTIDSGIKKTIRWWKKNY